MELVKNQYNDLSLSLSYCTYYFVHDKQLPFGYHPFVVMKQCNGLLDCR